jgi:hypothetical protein
MSHATSLNLRCPAKAKSPAGFRRAQALGLLRATPLTMHMIAILRLGCPRQRTTISDSDNMPLTLTAKLYSERHNKCFSTQVTGRSYDRVIKDCAIARV